jgi:hypothetical protein
MRLVRLDIRNFRLLRDVSIRLDETQTTTILVGPNNSGKTSVAEALMLFTEGDGKAFSIYDLSVSSWGCFGWIEKAMLEEAPEVAAIPALPTMSMDLHFQYGNDDADLAVASDLLMDVDSESYHVRLRIEYAIKDAEKLTKEYRETRRENETLFAFLASRMKEHYGLTLFKVAPDGSESEPLEDHKILDRLIKVNFVFAQRHIDDQEHSRATRLSHLLHAHYEKHYKTAEPEDHRQIEDSLKAYAETLGSRYMKAFDGLIGNLRQFGYPQRRAPSMAIKAELNATTLFHDNTRIWYGPATEALLAGVSPAEAAASMAPAYELPEKYNGLGFKNLIYMILQIQSFRIALTRMPEDRPRVHVVFIEEPETHLHPQVQSVFIGQLSAFLNRDGEGADAQVMLTTHSSHVVADSGFAPIRYFRRRESHVEVRDLLEFEKGSLPPDALRFLTRYLSLMRCDLFFADKVILVEGQVEKLLLPKMIADCAAKGHPAFASEYITIMEVGGAHAHKFRSLLKFIEVPTLVITDLDAVGADGKMCRVADGTSTSNATLKSWLPGKTALSDMQAAVAADKTDGSVRIAYQISEDGVLPCARTFEEAFIYCNAEWLISSGAGMPVTASTVARSCAADLVRDAYDVQPPKVDFALDLMVTEGWQAPRYIAEGLAWLAAYETVP